MWREYITATKIEEAIEFLAECGSSARIIAGATDLMLEIDNGVRAGIDTLIDITRIDGLDKITQDDEGGIHLGPMVTHNQCVASNLIVERAFPLAQAAWEVGAPQIRNRGTIAGNLITASPANDTITPLMALGAKVTLRSASGERVVPLDEFFTGVRKTVMKPDEMLVDIRFPALDPKIQKAAFIKLGLRNAQAIAVVNVAVVLTMDGDKVGAAAITLGSVAPSVIHAKEAENFLVGQILNEETISQAATLTMQAAKPIDDIRGSAAYRKEMVKVLTGRLLEQLANGTQQKNYPEKPILLSGKGETANLREQITHKNGNPIQTTVNGKTYTVEGASHKSLLRMLRENLFLVGSKEGCAEGECGACTVILDGSAVMSCLVPAPRAHGAEIFTIEGLAEGDELHPVQESFVQDGAVQCGYCTPGMIMSAVKLLEENSDPSQDEIKHAIAGNLCRCTGYHKIIQAIENAGR
jgi:xanthine dehydrogenase iron-sulfur cluster and FAD-binding subunit A